MIAAMTSGWFDARGCFSAEGMAALRAAEPGKAPPELAAHLASCASCQERLLVLENPNTPRAAPVSRDPRRPWRNLALVGLAVLVMLFSMTTTICRVG